MHLALQALLVVGGSCTLAVLVHRAVRRLVPLEVLEEHHAVAGVLLSLVGGLYGILLAFVMVAVWKDYEDARQGVAAEANAAVNVARLARGLSAPSGPELQDASVAYLEAVVHDEWPRMAEGRTSERAEQHVDRMWQLLVTYAPEGAGTANLHRTALEQMDQLGAQRRLRVIANEYRLPPLLWAVLVLGAVATLGFVNFFGLRYPRSELLMTATVALVLSAVLFTIMALDRPFRGGLRLPPTEVEALLRQMRDS